MNLKFYLLFLLIPFIPLTSWAQKSGSETDPGILLAGFAKIDITPGIPVKLYGYEARKGYSEGVHDPLSARAVAFENNGKRIILVSCDLGSFENDLFSVVKSSILKKYNIGDSELFLAVIHSHSSPVLSLDPAKGDPNNIIYTKAVIEKILSVIGEAIGDLKPVLTGVGTGSSPIGANRREMNSEGEVILGRNPYGPADKEVLVMKVTSPEGKNIGAIFDYATHATSLGWLNMSISGDVLGLSSQFTEQILGKGAITPVFAGASGNIDPWYRVLPGFNNEPGWIPEPVLLGTLLGEEVIHVFRDISELKQGGNIKSASYVLNCPAKKPSGQSYGYKQDSTSVVPVTITAAKIGDDIAFIGFNVEMLTEIGMRIKEASPFKHTFIVTHCNGYSGYLPPAELYKEDGYEISSTPFGIESASMVEAKALEMLYYLKR